LTLQLCECCFALVDVSCSPSSWRAVSMLWESMASPGAPTGPSHVMVARRSGEFICELAPVALLSTSMGVPDPVPCWVLVSRREQSPSVSPGHARPPGAWSMAKEFILTPRRCGLQPAVSSLGSSGHSGSLGAVSCGGLMTFSHPRASSRGC